MKVAIVGGSPSSEHLAPYNDKSWEVWVLGNRLDKYENKRVTKVFEIHDDLTEHENPKLYCDWLIKTTNDINAELIVGDKFPLKAIKYPYKEVKKLSTHCTLASSPAYMMAYAILKGAKEIGIYGVDLAVDDHEYFWQRPCMWGWIRFAEAKGIKIHIPKESALMQMNYEEGRDWRGGFKGKAISQFALPPFTEIEFKEMALLHQKQIDAIQLEIEERKKLIHTHSGCRQAYEIMSKVARAVEAGQSNINLKTTVK